MGLILADQVGCLSLLISVFAGILLVALYPKARWHVLFLLIGWLRYEWEFQAMPAMPAEIPAPCLLRVAGEIEPTASGRYSLLVRPLNPGGAPMPYDALLYMPQTLQWYPEYGQILRLNTSLRKPANRRDASFDFVGYLQRRRIVWTGFVHSVRQFEIVQEAPSSPVRWFAGLRSSIRHTLRAHLSFEDASIVEGLILGAAGDFPKELRGEFFRSGIGHALSASGMHLFMITWLLSRILLALRLPLRGRIHALIGGMWFYALLAGGESPIVRSAIMATLYVAAPLFGRVPDGLSALGWAAFLWLLFAPGDLWTPSFLLSFSATLGLILFYPLISGFLLDSSRKRLGKQRILETWIWKPLSATLAAELGILPILGLYDNPVSIWTPIANLLAAPVVFGLLAWGFVVWFALGAGASVLAFGCVLLKGIAHTFGHEDVTTLPLGPFSNIWVGPIYGIFLATIREPTIPEPED